MTLDNNVEFEIEALKKERKFWNCLEFKYFLGGIGGVAGGAFAAATPFLELLYKIANNAEYQTSSTLLAELMVAGGATLSGLGFYAVRIAADMQYKAIELNYRIQSIEQRLKNPLHTDGSGEA